VYGLVVRSDIELPELQSVDSEDTTDDAVIQRGQISPVPESAGGSDGERFQADPEKCHLTYDGVGSFLIESGERIQYDPATAQATQTGAFRKILLNQGLGLLLHQRGYLVLHASAVSIGGRAVVFLGERGAGKSTTAAALHLRGFPVIADDVVGITIENGEPTVVPGVAHLHLTADTAGLLDIEHSTTEGTTRKRQYRAEGVSTPVPLRRIYHLEGGESVSLRTLSGRASFLTLLDNSYATAVLSDTETVSDHFRLCSDVLEEVPCRRLQRPKDAETLPTIIEQLRDDCPSPTS